MISVKLVNYTTEPEIAMGKAAAVCYGDKTAEYKELLDKCIKDNHLAITEFSDFTFRIEGMSRSCLAQLTRHRVASYAVRSQRYCNEDDFPFVVPPKIHQDADARNVYMKAMNDIKKAYKTLCSYGVPKEDARYVLPNACSTVVEVKMNFRELMHFCNERLCSKAQWEIREIAQMMKTCVGNVSSSLAEKLVPKCEKHYPICFCTEGKSCGRHAKLEAK